MARLLGKALVSGLSGFVLTAVLVVAPHVGRAEENWATQRAGVLCSQGDAHRDGGKIDLAMERYRQALEIDPTFGAAYLALGGLREAMGDADEAERTYTAGIDHVAGFAEGYSARATLRLRASRGDEGLADLDAALTLKPTDVSVVRRLRDASISLGKLPLALSMSRKLAVLAAAEGDASAEHEARVTVTALLDLIGFVDPVLEGRGRSAVRSALARAVGPTHASKSQSGAGKQGSARPTSVGASTAAATKVPGSDRPSAGGPTPPPSGLGGSK